MTKRRGTARAKNTTARQRKRCEKRNQAKNMKKNRKKERQKHKKEPLIKKVRAMKAGGEETPKPAEKAD